MTTEAIAPVQARDSDVAGRASANVRAIINTSAGTALDLTRERIRAAVEGAFADEGQRVEVVFAEPENVEGAIQEAVASGVGAIVVGGGDGTVRTAARHLVGREITLGILPLGTLNRLARDLQIPLRLEDAARFLATASPNKIDVAKVNGSIFLCNSLMGASLHFSVGRARLRGKPASERLPKYLALIGSVLSCRRKISILVDNGSEQMQVRALSFAVTNNGYDEKTPWLRRSRLDRGKLTLYVSKHRNGWGMVKALARASVGLWHGDPDMFKLTGSRFIIHSKARRRTLSNDGEVHRFETPLQYEIVPQSLTVLMKPVED